MNTPARFLLIGALAIVPLSREPLAQTRQNLASSARSQGASDPYAFYAEFRTSVRQFAAEARKDPKAVLDRYRAKLSSEGVDAKEVDRRIHLIETQREFLETEFWNRYFTHPDNKGVAEGGVTCFGGVNGLLRLLESLRVRRYEDTLATSDFFNRSQMQVVRYCGEKP